MNAILKTALKLLLGRGSFRSFSQFGEDAVTLPLVRSIRNGTYIEVGAYHPTLYSNTYAFYRTGWRGLVIDPSPAALPLFHTFRPRDTFVLAAVGSEAGALTYYEYEDGAYNSLDTAQVERLKHDKGVSPVRTSQVPVTPLGTILKAHNITSIDILSVDVEGMDLDVLESHDWSIRPKVIIAEDATFDITHPDESAIYRLITRHGYRLENKAGLSLVFVEEKRN
jgi:FkbM family methyltransferase